MNNNLYINNNKKNTEKPQKKQKPTVTRLIFTAVDRYEHPTKCTQKTIASSKTFQKPIKTSL